MSTYRDPNPHCNKCNRPVQYMALEMPTEVVSSANGPDEVRHTGEKIIIVRCHGEEFRMSNRERGHLS